MFLGGIPVSNGFKTSISILGLKTTIWNPRGCNGVANNVCYSRDMSFFSFFFLFFRSGGEVGTLHFEMYVKPIYAATLLDVLHALPSIM